MGALAVASSDQEVVVQVHLKPDENTEVEGVRSTHSCFLGGSYMVSHEERR